MHTSDTIGARLLDSWSVRSHVPITSTRITFLISCDRGNHLQGAGGVKYNQDGAPQSAPPFPFSTPVESRRTFVFPPCRAMPAVNSRGMQSTRAHKFHSNQRHTNIPAPSTSLSYSLEN